MSRSSCFFVLAIFAVLLCSANGGDRTCKEINKEIKRDCRKSSLKKKCKQECNAEGNTQKKKKCERRCRKDGKKACKKLKRCVDGGWSDPDWSACSVTCGGGEQTKDRACTSPAPANGGNVCVGVAILTQICNTHDCPVDGGWSNPDWSTCSVTCGGGEQTKDRACTSPAPANGGKVCIGNATLTQICNTHDCPVDGGWSNPDWSACSVTCGGGEQTKDRACNSPAPANGGNVCVGVAILTQICNTHDCPGNSCPSSHPFVYSRGKYCCATNREKVYAPNGASCDGGIIGFDSSCCKDDHWSKCRSAPCDNYANTVAGNSCPSSHPFVYSRGKYCCAVDREKVYAPNGASCDGGKIGFDSTCCKDDLWSKCRSAPCDNYANTAAVEE